MLGWEAAGGAHLDVDEELENAPKVDGRDCACKGRNSELLEGRDALRGWQARDAERGLAGSDVLEVVEVRPQLLHVRLAVGGRGECSCDWRERAGELDGGGFRDDPDLRGRALLNESREDAVWIGGGRGHEGTSTWRMEVPSPPLKVSEISFLSLSLASSMISRSGM